MSIPQLSPIRQFPARLRKLAAILEVGCGAISLLPKLAKIITNRLKIMRLQQRDRLIL